MSQNKISKSLLNIILVFVESALTIILRFDPKLRQAAYPLAKSNTLVCIRTYLPHTQFYATFSAKGILLDDKLPNSLHEPDVVINAYSTQLFTILVSHDANQVSKLPMRGTSSTIEHLRTFLLQLGMGSLIRGIVQSFKGKRSSDTEANEAAKHSVAAYKEQLEEKQAQLDLLTIKNRKLEISRKELDSKVKTMMVAMAILVIITLVAVVGWLG